MNTTNDQPTNETEPEPFEQTLATAIIAKLGEKEPAARNTWAVICAISDTMKEHAAFFILPRSGGIYACATERARQVQEKGYTAEHDHFQNRGELADAAKAYLAAYGQIANTGFLPPSWPPFWPWHPNCWKPSTDPQRNLQKAMALLAAEWDRFERLKAPPAPGDLKQGELICPGCKEPAPESEMIGGLCFNCAPL